MFIEGDIDENSDEISNSTLIFNTFAEFEIKNGLQINCNGCEVQGGCSDPIFVTENDCIGNGTYVDNTWSGYDDNQWACECLGGTCIEDSEKNSFLTATRISGFSKDFSIEQNSKAKKWASRIWDINPSLIKTNITSEAECPVDHKWSESNKTCYSYPIFHDKGRIGQLIKGFFGYNGDPSLIEFFAWLLSVIGFTYMWAKVSNKRKK